jgi:hypothetical protein
VKIDQVNAVDGRDDMKRASPVTESELHSERPSTMPPQNPTFRRPPVDDAYDAAAVVQAWHRRIKANGPFLPTPTIAQAQSAGYGSLVAECTHCNRTAHVPFASIRRPPATPIADLRRALICIRCGQKGPPAATIRGVTLHAHPIPDEDIPPSITTITIDIPPAPHDTH